MRRLLLALLLVLGPVAPAQAEVDGYPVLLEVPAAFAGRPPAAATIRAVREDAAARNGAILARGGRSLATGR